jgi:hypothetical protein
MKSPMRAPMPTEERHRKMLAIVALCGAVTICTIMIARPGWSRSRNVSNSTWRIIARVFELVCGGVVLYGAARFAVEEYSGRGKRPTTGVATLSTTEEIIARFSGQGRVRIQMSFNVEGDWPSGIQVIARCVEKNSGVVWCSQNLTLTGLAESDALRGEVGTAGNWQGLVVCRTARQENNEVKIAWSGIVGRGGQMTAVDHVNSA